MLFRSVNAQTGPIFLAYRQNETLKAIVAEEKDNFSTPYGFAVLKGQNADLLKMFNEGLKNIKANGTYDEIVAKYTSAK